MEEEKIKTTLITGFLGTGKTTYLNHIIQSNPSTRFAIIENEFGEESIDGELLIHTPTNLIELNNGCLCCSLNDNLFELLAALYKRKDEFDELLIEATGVANPENIAAPFLSHPAVKNAYKLINTICLIDPEQIKESLENTEEARLQISFSDTLLITKTDLVSNNKVDEVRLLLEKINPWASLLIKKDGTYPNPQAIGNIFCKQHIHKSPSTCEHKNKHETCGHDHKQIKNHSHQHTDISTHSFVFENPIDISILKHQLFVLVTIQSKDLYRVKGFVFDSKSSTPYLVQSVGKRLVVAPFPKWLDHSKKQSKLVFIGKNLKADGFRKMIERSRTDK